MKKLLKDISDIKNTGIKRVIDKRLKEFKQLLNAPYSILFKELCFCLLTANFNAERSITIQNKINNGFLTLNETELGLKLKNLGYRFPKTRAHYIYLARSVNLKNILKLNTSKIREELIKQVKGLGLKEASHFLRNIGYDNFAIIDFHIIDVLSRYNIISKPKTLTKNKYYYIENLLKKIAIKSNLSLAALDLYLWYLETGKVLK